MSNTELVKKARSALRFINEDSDSFDHGGEPAEAIWEALDALEAAESPTSQMLTEDGRATVVALGDYLFAHHPTAEPDIAKAALATIKALEAESPTTVEWGIKWAEIIPGFLDIAIGYESEALASAAAGRSAFPGTVVFRNISAGPWIPVQS
ncbi:hypothetical protein E3T43_18125 [Cryobacterium sp. Hh7]|uniref:hypothetical protein n=1 Tax=Cryobacterium sp. Hh7 TaxID=1259159 RepID=UPI00106A074C|nr:hypothetical protein [Cryobacterium sp. Hh7]TFD50440.1 hypothetical protein E3T43_18125 [Cryobacterium sp. Hh7]